MKGDKVLSLVKKIEKDFSLCPMLMTRRKTSFSSSLPSSKLTVFLILCTVNILVFMTQLFTGTRNYLFLHAVLIIFCEEG